MPISPTSPNLSAAIQRSNYSGLVKLPRKECDRALELFAEAMDDDDVLEVSWASLCQRADGRGLSTDPALCVLFNTGLSLFVLKGLVKKRLDEKFMRFDGYKAAVEDELGGPERNNCDFAIQFLAAGNTPLFRIAWPYFTGGMRGNTAQRIAAATERDRFLGALVRVSGQ